MHACNPLMAMQCRDVPTIKRPKKLSNDLMVLFVRPARIMAYLLLTNLSRIQFRTEQFHFEKWSGGLTSLSLSNEEHS